MGLDELLPVANWPAKSGKYKVIQLEIDDKPYLCFGKTNQKDMTRESLSEFHARILASFLEATGREFPEMYVMGVYVPALKSKWYVVHGAGSAEIKVKRKMASFFGKSSTYGISINEKHLDWVKPFLPDWTLVKEQE